MTTPLSTAAWVLPTLGLPPRRRAAALRDLDVQLERVADAPVRAAAQDAIVAQIVLDVLPLEDDIPTSIHPLPRCIAFRRSRSYVGRFAGRMIGVRGVCFPASRGLAMRCGGSGRN